MDHDELLLAVFRFKNQAPSTTQTAAFCCQLRDALAAVAGRYNDLEDPQDEGPLKEPIHLDPQCDDRQTPLAQVSPRERAWLRRGWTQLFPAVAGSPPIGAVWTVEWFPAYAGVLQAEQVGVDTIALRVVALDKWAWTRHFLPSGECLHSAVPTQHVVLACGRVATASLAAFRMQLTASLELARQRTGTLRSAASDSSIPGHQKTPQFLVAAVRTAIDKVSESTSRVNGTHKPRGGMTDVGLHTGGTARDTCWSLVCATLRQSLPASCVLGDKMLLEFSATLLEKELNKFKKGLVSSSSDVDVFWNQVDKCMEMLDMIGVTVLQLVDDGYDGNAWLERCKRWRASLDDAAARWNEELQRPSTFLICGSPCLKA